MQYTVLASGSRGNSTLLQSNGFGLLIDVGLALDDLTARLKKCRRTWDHVDAVILTHTHGDHWTDAVFTEMLRREVPLYCHTDHCLILEKCSQRFAKLGAAGLLRDFPTSEAFTLSPGLSCLPTPVRHDSGATFAFRLEGETNLFGESQSVGHATDLGCWDEFLAERLANVDLLAVESNHDVQMQRGSRRPYRLINRVLGDDGHLSNEQAAKLAERVRQLSDAKQFRHLVLLQLSEQCNQPHLALDAAHGVVKEMNHAKVYAARQDRPLSTIQLDVTKKAKRRTKSSRHTPSTHETRSLERERGRSE